MLMYHNFGSSQFSSIICLVISVSVIFSTIIFLQAFHLQSFHQQIFGQQLIFLQSFILHYFFLTAIQFTVLQPEVISLTVSLSTGITPKSFLEYKLEIFSFNHPKIDEQDQIWTSIPTLSMAVYALRSLLSFEAKQTSLKLSHYLTNNFSILSCQKSRSQV